MKDYKGFLKLIQSVDAFFPIGAFTLSNGLEDYVAHEDIKDCEDLEQYLKGFLRVFPYQDLGLLALAYKNAFNREIIASLDEVAGAMKTAMEVRVGSIKMCSRYIKVRGAIKDAPDPLSWYQNQIQDGTLMGYHPIALGIFGACENTEIEQLLLMYSYSIVSAIANNTVKLVPLSQMEGQRILYNILKDLVPVVKEAMSVDIDDIGVSGSLLEIHCMNHERLYSRQYMS